jgi:hypothetical protein
MRSLKDYSAKITPHLLPSVSYALPALLLITLVYMILNATIFGTWPTPGSPPHEYYAEEDRVRLLWHRGTHKGPFTVQVAQGGDFKNPVFTKKTKQTKLLLPRLKPGKRYCWRAVAHDRAPVSCFHTSHRLVAY